MDKRVVHFYRSTFKSSMEVAEVLQKSDYIAVLKMAEYGRGDMLGMVGCSRGELADVCKKTYEAMGNVLVRLKMYNVVRKDRNGLFFLNPTVHYSGNNIKHAVNKWVEKFGSYKVEKEGEDNE